MLSRTKKPSTLDHGNPAGDEGHRFSGQACDRCWLHGRRVLFARRVAGGDPRGGRRSRATSHPGATQAGTQFEGRIRLARHLRCGAGGEWQVRRRILPAVAADGAIPAAADPHAEPADEAGWTARAQHRLSRLLSGCSTHLHTCRLGSPDQFVWLHVFQQRRSAQCPRLLRISRLRDPRGAGAGHRRVPRLCTHALPKAGRFSRFRVTHGQYHTIVHVVSGLC